MFLELGLEAGYGLASAALADMFLILSPRPECLSPNRHHGFDYSSHYLNLDLLLLQGRIEPGA